MTTTLEFLEDELCLLVDARQQRIEERADHVEIDKQIIEIIEGARGLLRFAEITAGMLANMRKNIKQHETKSDTPTTINSETALHDNDQSHNL